MVAINKRAVSPEQKAFRREQILAAAGEMFAVQPYEAVNLTALAETVGITKPALYRYFRGKEVLFLALFEKELVRVKQAFSRLSQSQDLAGDIANVFGAHPLYCRLSAILHTVLERDLTYEEALAFKLSMKKEVVELSQQLAVLLGTADAGLVFDRLKQMQQALIGAWHMTHPAGAVADVLERDDLALFRSDFEESLAKHLRVLLQS